MVGFSEMVFSAALGFASTAILVLPFYAFVRANLRTYHLFGYDKSQAEAGGQRVPEAELLRAARRGGWIGAKLAQRRFRHKTHKEPFRSNLNRIGTWQAMLIATLGLAAILAPPLPQPDSLAFPGVTEPQQVVALTSSQAHAATFAPDRSLRPVPRPKPPRT